MPVRKNSISMEADGIPDVGTFPSFVDCVSVFVSDLYSCEISKANNFAAVVARSRVSRNINLIFLP